jgi:hypothetical protein
VEGWSEKRPTLTGGVTERRRAGVVGVGSCDFLVCDLIILRHSCNRHSRRRLEEGLADGQAVVQEECGETQKAKAISCCGTPDLTNPESAAGGIIFSSDGMGSKDGKGLKKRGLPADGRACWSNILHAGLGLLAEGGEK